MTGRPKPTEAAAYYFRYIDRVSGDEPVAVLSSQLDEMEAMCSTISEEKSLHRYAPDKWSIRQVLNHLTDTERVMASRAFWFARGFDSALPSFDQEVAVAGAEADRLPWAVHVGEFQQVRRSTIALFKNLPDEAWSRSGIASDNTFSVRALAWLIAGHQAHHLDLLRERYL